jgi:SAM-dependent methyltransferase
MYGQRQEPNGPGTDDKCKTIKGDIMLIKYNCPICEANDWEYLDHLRDQKYWYVREMREEGEPVGFKICKDCGYVSYDYIDEKRLADIYDLQRPVMTANNITTANRKNHYHAQFLDGITIEGNCLDVGCAQGSFLNWLHEARGIAKGRLFGTEYSKSFGNWCKYVYGISSDPSNESWVGGFYDFVSYYHVLEHVQYPGQELEKIKQRLVEGGLVYISVPTWFDVCEEASGAILNDFENYFHLNHVNVFSVKSFNNLLKKHGFKVIKMDDTLYGYTVLCEIDESIDKTIEKEDYKEIIKIIEAQKAAIECLQPEVNNPQRATELYPKYPDAYIYWALDKNNMKKFDPQEQILMKGLSLMPGNHRLRGQLARLYYQWDENSSEKLKFYSNNIKKAESILIDLFNEKSGSEEHLFMLAMINHRFKKCSGQAIKMLDICAKINPLRFVECMNNIGAICKEYDDSGEE